MKCCTYMQYLQPLELMQRLIEPKKDFLMKQAVCMACSILSFSFMQIDYSSSAFS